MIQRHGAFMSALVTEHFVLQTGADAATGEMGSARLPQRPWERTGGDGVCGPVAGGLRPFATVPAGRLRPRPVHRGAAGRRPRRVQPVPGRYCPVREQYRVLSPEAAAFFAAEHGRWPEEGGTPALGLGAFIAFITTTASMVAFVNSVVAGAVSPSWAGCSCASGRVLLALGALAAALPDGGVPRLPALAPRHGDRAPARQSESTPWTGDYHYGDQAAPLPVLIITVIGRCQSHTAADHPSLLK